MYKSSDFTKDWYKVGEVAKILGMSVRGVQEWDTRGVLTFDRTETGRRLLPKDRLLAYLEANNQLFADDGRRDVVYARVSSQDQKSHGDLDRQALFLIEHEGHDMRDPLVLKECGSGMNAKRTKVQQLIRMVMNDEVRNVYVTYRDRLTRFGYEYLETAFAAHGTSIVVVRDENTDKSVQEELVEDMMSLIASFSGKLYGLRSHKNKEVTS